MGGEKEGEAVASFFWIEQCPETLNRKRLPLCTSCTDVKAAVCCFNTTVINMCIYLVSLQYAAAKLFVSKQPSRKWVSTFASLVHIAQAQSCCLIKQRSMRVSLDCLGSWLRCVFLPFLWYRFLLTVFCKGISLRK